MGRGQGDSVLRLDREARPASRRQKATAHQEILSQCRFSQETEDPEAGLFLSVPSSEKRGLKHRKQELALHKALEPGPWRSKKNLKFSL